MGFVEKEYSKRGTRLEIDIRGRRVEGEVVRFPFYDKTEYGWTKAQS